MQVELHDLCGLLSQDQTTVWGQEEIFRQGFTDPQISNESNGGGGRRGGVWVDFRVSIPSFLYTCSLLSHPILFPTRSSTPGQEKGRVPTHRSLILLGCSSDHKKVLSSKQRDG